MESVVNHQALNQLALVQKQAVETRDEEAKERARKADERAEALDLALICAQDIVDAWPELTMRKLGEMTKRVDTLRLALEAARK